MKIHGLQKMTLLDFPGHVACTVFLGGCDLRCPYCHNYELATGQAPAVMEEEEKVSWTALRSRAASLVCTATCRNSSRRSASWDFR